MKRIKNIYQQFCSIENLRLADKKARRGKAAQPGVIEFDKNPDSKLFLLHESLLNKTYRTSPYTIFTIKEPKEREIFRLPYFPDRIAHHAAMNVLHKMFIATFTADTYSCIEGKGIHGAVSAVKQALKDVPGTKHCLKLDIKKFYPNIDHVILKALLRRKIKDADMLLFLDEVIDSAPGLPIGNYLSQYFANFYLSYFDHWVKEVMGVKYYFRYADDIVVFASNKPYLHALLAEFKTYLDKELKLTVKSNYQIFPTEARGVDFLGYVFFHGYTRMRKTIKQNFARKIKQHRNPASIASYMGWAKAADCIRLIKKIVYDTAA